MHLPQDFAFVSIHQPVKLGLWEHMCLVVVDEHRPPPMKPWLRPNLRR